MKQPITRAEQDHEGVATPRAAAVRDNNWQGVRPAAETFTPTLPVSVIISYFEAPEALALTLAALERQTWPRDLFEVVIVDDGSSPPLARPRDTPLDVKVVRQENRGFGLARARNTGARAAAHDVLVFLDGDVIAESSLLAAHARWHHVVSDALTMGFCAYVSVKGFDAAAIRGRPGSVRELLADRAFDPPWMERHMAGTGELTAKRDDLFRAMTGNNFAMGREFYWEVGGCDESFTRYGGEDTEFGYRVQVRGGLLVPVRDAFGWHQGRWNENRQGKDRNAQIQRGKLANLIPLPGFRPNAPGRTFAVPRHVVTIEAGDAPEERLIEAVRNLLAEGDLVVRIESREGDDPAWLETRLGPDPNVRLAPSRQALDEFPASPFHVSLPAGAVVRPGLVRELRNALGDAAVLTSGLADGARVSITRAWALHRARRVGGTAADFGDAVTIRKLRFTGRGRRRTPRAHRGVPAALERVLDEARHVRGWRTGWRFLKWLVSGIRWWLRVRRGSAPETARGKAAATRADPALGAEITVLGARARAVFRASSRVAQCLDGRHVDVVLADAPDEEISAPAVILSEARELSVPALDPAIHNPIGWVREVENRVAALGPPDLLPPGVTAHRVVAPNDLSALRHVHHLVDVGGFHPDAIERAGTLLRLAATGLPIHLADRDPAMAELLGPELHALMTTDVRGADATRRETLSIRMRRAALRDHSLKSRARQICEVALADPPELPRVSILLASRRPWRLQEALANVARQTYPRLELILALHGPGFAPDAAEPAGTLVHPVKVLRLGADLVLGTVLNATVAEATGSLLVKMDDDDVYGPDHVWDLVLAHEYSGAELVGKFPATVYLAGQDRTVRRRPVRSETWSRSITGGTMLIAQSDLEHAGGWQRVRRHVDQALIDDVLRIGGGIYRTHDAGYVLVRHRDRHIWETDDDDFLAQAEAVLPGWHPALAGIEDAPRPSLPEPAGERRTP